MRGYGYRLLLPPGLQLRILRGVCVSRLCRGMKVDSARRALGRSRYEGSLATSTTLQGCGVFTLASGICFQDSLNLGVRLVI